MPPQQARSAAHVLNPSVFFPASVLIFVLLAFSIAIPGIMESWFSSLQATIVANGSWFYVMSVALILVSVVMVGITHYGDIRLGPDHSTPEYSLSTWLAMLFAAGMGIGLMYFGVAEPLMHFIAPPTAEPNTVAAVREAMRTTFFHWGLHAWAIYAVVALILAYFSFRHNLPLTLRSALYPLIGDKIYGRIGDIVDIFAVIGTIFGVATSLGIGASQINSGFAYLFAVEVTITNQIIIMAGVVLFAVVSVSTGLDKGIRRLSELNMMLAIGLLLLILISGSTVFLLTAYVQNIGSYLSDIVRNTFHLFAYEKTDWIGGWTIFYWGWWLAWAPFVGLFIARISHGRTIREFVFGVLLIPTLFTLLWMTVFGNSAIDLVYTEGHQRLADAVSNDVSVALFAFLEHFAASEVLSLVAVLMIVVFFVTSCDSGAMVVDMLCSNGSNETPIWQRVYWTVVVGVVAAVLSLAGGLTALQTMTITAALPFAIILLIAMFGLFKSLRVDVVKRDSLLFSASPQGVAMAAESWQERLGNIINFPNKVVVDVFLDKTVRSAFEAIASELRNSQIEVHIQRLPRAIELTVKHKEELDFVYGVYRRKHLQPDFVTNEADDSENEDDQSYFRAEVFLREGGQDYDVMGWSKTAVINDIIDQYQKHLHFLHRLR